MGEPALFNHYFDRAISALRRGEEGEIGFALRGVADFLMTNITLTGKFLTSQIVTFINRFAEAQERGDWVRLADMLEFELPKINDVRNFPFSSVRIAFNESQGLSINQPIRFNVELIPSSFPGIVSNTGDVEYAYHLQYMDDRQSSEYLEQTLVRAYSSDPEWVWIPKGPPGRYRVTLWIRRAQYADMHCLDVEDIVDLEISAGT